MLVMNLAEANGIRQTDELIDAVVYKLCGLTEEGEIRIVEGTKIKLEDLMHGKKNPYRAMRRAYPTGFASKVPKVRGFMCWHKTLGAK
jgi:U3 small nucleolar ribonucleoprotein component